PYYGTTHRILSLIVAFQLITILASRGDTFLLGEAYAFGVVWSFVFQAFSMVVLRFKDPRPREFRVPLNLKVGGIELPIGLLIILLILLVSACLNFFTKEVATVGGLAFTGVFFILFTFTERLHTRRTKGQPHQHTDMVSPVAAKEVTAHTLGLTR